MSSPTSKPIGTKAGWRTHQSDLLYSSQWFSLRTDQVSFPNGHQGTYTYVEHPGSVLVVPLLKDGRVVLIRSYRYTIDAYCGEVPAGRVEPNQTPSECATAELREEIGGRTNSLEHLTTLHIANGFANCPCHFFLAHDVVLDTTTAHEDGETITTIEAVPLNEAVARMTMPSASDGNRGDADSVLALLLAMQHLCEAQR